MKKHWILAVAVLATCLTGLATIALSSTSGTALAAVAFQDIASTGPLEHVYVGNDLSCQIAHTGDVNFELYPPTTTPGDCGTFLVVGGVLYAPDFANHGVTATGGLGTFTAFTPVSQSAVTGTGASGDPLKVVTVADAGTTGLRITETDTYVIGAESYRTDVVIQNTGNANQSVLVFRGGDCYLGGTDQGYGIADASTKSVGCTKTANNTPPDRVELWSPITPADHFYEEAFDTVWTAIGAKTNLPDTCGCTTLQDNGAAIQWNRTIIAGNSTTLSHVTTFSPLGSQPLVVSKTADVGTVNAGASDGYTITVSNPNAGAITVSSIADTLPTGFTYTPGTSTGLTTTDPGIVGQVLTWTGSFSIAGSGSGALHFNVTVSSTAGTYFNNATAASSVDVVPSGDTAPITVVAATPTATSTTGATATSTPTAANTLTPTATATTAASETPTPTATNTSTSTATATTAASETPTPTATNTPAVTETSVATDTSTPTPEASGTAQTTRTVTTTRTVQSTRTVTTTHTPEGTHTATPSFTPGHTHTAVPTHTVTATRTPQSTHTPEATATGEPHDGCLTHRQKIRLLIGILRHYGAEAGERRYVRKFDVNGDGVIDVDDIMLVLDAPSCHHEHHDHHEH